MINNIILYFHPSFAFGNDEGYECQQIFKTRFILQKVNGIENGLDKLENENLEVKQEDLKS